jgi:ElaB/YqjD/DUF883 family membrane-anchored ribosome-binding protein
MMELAAMGGGAVLGHVFKMMDKAAEAKREQQKLMIEAMKAKTEEADAASARATAAADAAANRVGNDPFAKMTRRIFVLSMIGLGVWAMTGALTGLDIVIPVEKETGFNFLGLIDTTGTTTEFVRLENAIVHFEWLKISILAAGSFYLGKS